MSNNRCSQQMPQQQQQQQQQQRSCCQPILRSSTSPSRSIVGSCLGSSIAGCIGGGSSTPASCVDNNSWQKQLAPTCSVSSGTPDSNYSGGGSGSGSGIGICSASASAVSNETALESRCAAASASANVCCVSHPLPTEHYRQQLAKYTEEALTCGGETARVNAHLNNIFLKRLQDIDCNAEGDADLKLITYQEWVDMLLKINDSIITNMEGLESEVVERLELLNRKSNSSNCRHSQGNELLKCRKDICTLVKLIQNGYHNDNWNLQGLHFETLTPAQVLGLDERQMRCMGGEGGPPVQKPACGMNAETAQRNKFILNMKALAIEVASKHDEIRELKQQILCLEDEIQKAQKKIQLKDDVIRELRNDLKCLQSKQSCQSLDFPLMTMAPINLESQQTTRSATTQVSDKVGGNVRYADDCSQFESLSNNEQLENEKLKELEDELNDLFEMAKDLKKQNLEYHRKRLSDIFQKSESEKAEAYRKLDFIRRQLIDLEATGGREKWNDCDSGFSSKSENNQDAKILEALRRRLRQLNECSFDLKKRVQKLEIEKNELCSNLDTEKGFAHRSGETLKEVADLLCSMMGEQFNYNDIYGDGGQANPFCTAILQLERNFCDREQDYIDALTCRNKKINELKECMYNSQQQSSQDNNMQRVNESLKCQIEHLQRTICEKEQAVLQLNAMLTRLSSMAADPRQLCDCCGRSKQSDNDKEIRDLHGQLDQTRCRIESLLSELENSQKQERFLHAETRKLNEELLHSKQKHNDFICQIRRLAGLLKTQEAHRMDLSKKFEIMEQNYAEQSQKLRAANTQLNVLQERFGDVEKRGNEHTMERNLLREEVLALKEKESCLVHKHREISEKLLKTERELYKAHDVIKEQRGILQRNNCLHKDVVKRLQDASNDIRRQLDAVVQDYKTLEAEYKKQCGVCEQNEKIIESFRKWKDAQLQADEASRNSFKQYEEHIKALLAEKQKFLVRYRELHRDYSIIQNELERIKMSNLSVSGPSLNRVDTTLEQRRDLLRQTYQRISDQCKSLRNESISAATRLPSPPT